MMTRGEYKDGKKYVQESFIASCEADSKFRLRPAAFMDMTQEIAYLAATELGFGYDDLQEHGAVWVLSRMNIKFLEYPRWRDDVVLSTWHKGPHGPFFLRDFTLNAPSGKPFVVATSSWVIMDAKSRSLFRVEDLLPEDTSCPDNAIDMPAGKVVMPRDAETQYAGEHEVLYSDVDIIGHMNNVRYMVLAMDCIDYNELSSNSVKEITINFNHETRPGETIVLSKARKEKEGNVSYYIDGHVEEKQVFCVRIDF